MYKRQALTAEQIKKSTEGIKDSIPPEVVSISPAEGSLLSVEGKLSIEYNMSIAPVSYTHLDVYKRQHLGRHGSKDGIRRLCNGRCIHPVSYTHLVADRNL